MPLPEFGNSLNFPDFRTFAALRLLKALTVFRILENTPLPEPWIPSAPDFWKLAVFRLSENSFSVPGSWELIASGALETFSTFRTPGNWLFSDSWELSQLSGLLKTHCFWILENLTAFPIFRNLSFPDSWKISVPPTIQKSFRALDS